MRTRLRVWMASLLLVTSITAAAAAEQPLPVADDHAVLAESYASEARMLRAQAASHELMLQRYEHAATPAKGPPFPKATLAARCRKLVAAYRQAASDAEALAKMERALAVESPAPQ